MNDLHAVMVCLPQLLHQGICILPARAAPLFFLCFIFFVRRFCAVFGTFRTLLFGAALSRLRFFLISLGIRGHTEQILPHPHVHGLRIGGIALQCLGVRIHHDDADIIAVGQTHQLDIEFIGSNGILVSRFIQSRIGAQQDVLLLHLVVGLQKEGIQNKTQQDRSENDQKDHRCEFKADCLVKFSGFLPLPFSAIHLFTFLCSGILRRISRRRILR